MVAHLAEILMIAVLIKMDIVHPEGCAFVRTSTRVQLVWLTQVFTPTNLLATKNQNLDVSNVL